MSRILFLSPWYPFPPDNGAKTRVYNVLRCLAERHRVTLVAFAPAGPDYQGLAFCSEIRAVDQSPFDKPRWLRSMRFLLPRPIVTYPTRAMAHVVAGTIRDNRFDGAVAFTSTMAPYLATTAVAKVLDIDANLTDYAVERLRRSSQVHARLQANLSLFKTRAFERAMVRRFDGTIFLTEASQDLLCSRSANINTAIVGNGVDLAYYPWRRDQRDLTSLVYTGAMTFEANYDAAAWFLSEIFPLILRKMPSVTLRITGSIEGVDIHRLALTDNVNLTGHLPDVRPLVTRSSLCVIPLRMGPGQRMKILESMALGTPVVSTAKGVEGLDVVNGEHVLVADDPGDFASAVVRLLNDRASQDKLSVNARRLVEERYDWNVILPRYRAFVESAMDRR